MSKHTSGPWWLSPARHALGVVLGGPARLMHHGGSSVGQIAAACSQEWMEGGELEANATLISAAPDLLAALEDLKREIILSDVDMGYIEHHFRPWLDKASLAITKAKGGA